MTKKHLLPQFIQKRLPSLDSTQDKSIADLTAQVKYFYPDFGWTWYGVAWDGEDLMWGLVDGFEKELGYWRMTELMGNRGKLGLEIERDYHFTPTPLSTLLDAPPLES